ncbi:hypothetical protein [Lacticaseibacillus mingshuiensis]|uniref:Lipoprotein n=1 Tax=Lacticaseibacillus mingshuiensis TaxID=2799574 RepID=A0ABW4CHK8_9LACO|nr:hypothetical protein [Lacticaseibacillus mingshuiensis]
MKKKMTVFVILWAVVTIAVGWQVRAQLTRANEAEHAITQVTKATKALRGADFVSAPKSNLAAAYLNRASYTAGQAAKLKATMTPAQQAQLATAQKQIQNAELFVAVHTEAEQILNTDHVIRDTSYDNTNLNNAFQRLQAADKTYAKAAAADVKLVDTQATALAAIRAATTSDPTAAQLAAAKTAIEAVPVAAFRQAYLPLLDTLTPTAVPAENSAAQQAAAPAKSTTTEAATEAKTPAKDATTDKVTKADASAATATASSTSDTATAAHPASDAAAQSSSATTTDEQATTTSKPAKDTTAASTPATDANTEKKPAHEDATTDTTDTTGTDAATEKGTDPAVIGENGLYATMAEAVAAMKAAQKAAGSDDQATAYSVQLEDGTVHYTWSWLKDTMPAEATDIP